MINNRQGSRRRGRGGQQRGPNLGGQPGNRQDTRQRGNAAQLLEKYKSMARDSQLAGDRVQTESYLQFADHYFRVLSESRARFEEQNPRHGRDDEIDDEGDDDDSFDASQEPASDDRPQRAERPDRGERFNPRNRPRRDNREERPRDSADDNREAFNGGGGETIPFDVLPPAIGRDQNETESNESVDEEPRRPRRRARAARPADGDDEVAPAA